jgi:hypothetical protein
LLGRGGFGLVLEAEHVETGRRVALKVLTAICVESPLAFGRFEREGRLAASLNHPHCVFVFGAADIDGFPTVAMELMPGGTLQDEIRKHGRIPSKHAVDRILDVIDGLEAAQSMGIIHRDVKPSNCFIDDGGGVKIGDFGISKTLEPESPLTQTGGFVGTPVYASPEQVRGRDVDFRSDIYSVGATLYAMLAGTPPFVGGGVGDVLARVLSEEPPPLTAGGITIPRELVRIIRRMMAKDRTKRYQDYASVRAALLPFSSNGLGPAFLVSRLAAYAVDALPLMALSYAFYLWQSELILRGTWWVRPLLLIPSLLYFAVWEWHWGATIGKRLLRLRVTTTKGAPPSFLQTFLRIVILDAVLQLPQLVFLVPGLRYSPSFPLLVTLAYLLPWITMRWRNGFAGVHELVTGTRVMAVPRADVLTVPTLVDGGIVYTQVQELIGPYRPVRLVWSTDDEALLVGLDEVLKRPVWIHRLGSVSQGQSIANLAQQRPHRLRWLAGSRARAGGWDAYEVPSGVGLTEWVSRQGKLSWREIRPILTGLAEELLGRHAGPRELVPLSIDHVWVDQYGTVKLLDFPAARGRAKAIFSSPSDFLLHVAVFGLEGRFVSPQEPCNRPLAPIPAHATRLMQELARRSPLPVICDQLRAIATRPTVVTRVRRLGALLAVSAIPAASALVPSLGLAAFWGASGTPFFQMIRSSIELQRLRADERRGISTSPDLIAAHERIVAATYARFKDTPVFTARMPPELIQQFETALNHYPAVGANEYQAARRLIGAVQLSEQFAEANILPALFVMTVRVVALGAVAAVLLSVIFKAPLFRLYGIALRTARGSPAGPGRCLGRAIVGWLPFLWFLPNPVQPARWLTASPWWVGSAGIWHPAPWMIVLPWVIAVAAVIVALVRPSRGIPDLIVGTYLVPR